MMRDGLYPMEKAIAWRLSWKRQFNRQPRFLNWNPLQLKSNSLSPIP
jgi:hypothetical protein